MNHHKNARLTFARRLEMVQDLTERRLGVADAAAAAGVSEATARKWLGRFLVGGEAALCDVSSQPERRAITGRMAMPMLSKVVDGGRAVVLARIHFIDRSSGAFEVLAADATSLQAHVGQAHLLTCDGEEVFWGEVVHLEPCESSAAGLTALRDRPTLRGLLKRHLGQEASA